MKTDRDFLIDTLTTYADTIMRKSFIPYDKWAICRALRAYLESLVFPIPNTNEAIPGKFINICDIIIV